MQINNAHQPDAARPNSLAARSHVARHDSRSGFGKRAAKRLVDLLRTPRIIRKMVPDATILPEIYGVTTVISKINEEHFALCRLPE